MREIKFRAWDNVDYMSTPFTLQDVQEGKIQFTSDVKIMQFTGLTDRRGREIYEGDILKDADEIGAVECRDGYFSYNGAVMGCDQLEQSQMQHEIIGNIYENPNLLQSPNSQSK